jgi:1-deoxy-D-xylulose-5-phosphate reductoisomerase
MSRKKRVAILGSTGSIGTQALDVIARHPDDFDVVGLAAGRNVALLEEQFKRFGAAIATSARDGAAGLLRVAVESEPDILLAATDGSVAFDAVFAAVARGTDVAVANKELIVAAGDLLVDSAQRSGAQILPVDSEHSAIFQCLVGESKQSVAAIVLTASGGPFRNASHEEMERADVATALAHPTWRMGTKNTIDSATMMNKGLEVIEASRLLGFEGERIRIVVHPQSIAHGFVVFNDGNVKSQLAYPDMRLPIGYALSYPKRLESAGSGLPADGSDSDLLRALGAKNGEIALRYDFETADPVRFPCIGLAYEALAAGGTAPAVLSAANEIAVNAFVEGRIAFGRIPDVIATALTRTPPGEPSLDGVKVADREARKTAGDVVAAIERSSSQSC